MAFPLQQWLHERASILLDTFIACLVKTKPLIPKAAGHSGRAVLGVGLRPFVC
jgi:hypothetical protein